MLIHGNAFEVWGKFPDDPIDLILTSPPYADRRSEHYPTISEDQYPEYTRKWMAEAASRLKPNGSVILVIRSHVRKGAVSSYVLRTRLVLQEAGWCEPEELIWFKPTAPPVGHKKRPRRSWEHLLWFCREPQQVYCDPKANGHAAERVGMAHGKKQRMLGVYTPYPTPEVPGWSRCTDVVSVGTGECHQADYNTHPSQYPVKLCTWAIKMLTPEGGVVVDPFCGSGTTLVAAHQLGRRFAGSDLVTSYLDIAKQRLTEVGWSGEVIEAAPPSLDPTPAGGDSLSCPLPTRPG